MLHSIHPDAHGMAAQAILNGLLLKLLAKDLLTKDEALDLCETARKAWAAKGVKDDSAAESDAALITRTLMSEIQARF